MNIFSSEQEFLSTIEKHKKIVQDCVSEKISFQEFLDKYDNFYNYYALDGHESDSDEKAMFDKHQDKIQPFFAIWEEILTKICSDEDADKEFYIKANRFGSQEGLRRLKEISKEYSIYG